MIIPDFDRARKNLALLQEKLRAYRHAMSLLSFDGATTAPKGSAAGRAQTLATLSGELYQLQTGPETAALLDCLEQKRDELSPAERRAVELLGKELRRTARIPREEYIAYRKLLSQADSVWREAKERNDFALFEPVLERVFAGQIRVAQLCEPDRDPYDYWLDNYEEGTDKQFCDRFFQVLRGRIAPLLEKIRQQPQLSDRMLQGSFSISKQEELARRLMGLLRLDSNHVGLSTTEHPFTTWLGGHEDVRLTTHYHENDFPALCFPFCMRVATRCMPHTWGMSSWALYWTWELPWASMRARAGSMRT